MADALNALDSENAPYAEAGPAKFAEADFQVHMQESSLQAQEELKAPAAKTEFVKGAAEAMLAPAREALESGLDADPAVRSRIKLMILQELASAWIKSQIGDIEVSDEEALEYYLGNPCEFNVNARARLAHIMFKAEDMEQARKVFERIQAEPQRFGELAKEYSTDPSSGDRGGELGWMICEQMPEGFARAVFSAEIGHVVGPVEDVVGLHIIRVDERDVERSLTIDEARADIKDRLAQIKSQERAEKALKELNERKPPTVYEDLILEEAARRPLQVEKNDSEK